MTRRPRGTGAEGTASVEHSTRSVPRRHDEHANGIGPLRLQLITVAEIESVGLKDLTVLAVQNDPFRRDTPAGHRDGRWLAEVADQAHAATIHLRGLHYVAVSLETVRPNGLPYTNTDPDWTWLEGAAQDARWLRYVDFERIFDNRNSPPIVRLHQPELLFPYLGAGVEVEIPGAAELLPRVGIDGFAGVQPYRLVLIGEKSSLGPVLAPVAEECHADLYLPTGEISDTLVYKIAADTDIDGRPLVVLYFSDCDPAGWQMPISVARKLQAFRRGWFPEIEFEVHRVGLTPGQVREYGLPSTPLKDTERRADRWREEMGVDQTEIDALAALQPELLREIALDAIAPYFDAGLERRVDQARREWRRAAQAVVDAHITDDARAAAEGLAGLQGRIDELNAALEIDIEDLDLPEAEVPDPEIDTEGHPLPLISSEWGFLRQTRRLIASKAYRLEEER